jgi:hypothetical protein
MDNSETLSSLGTHDTGRKQTKHKAQDENKQNTKHRTKTNKTQDTGRKQTKHKAQNENKQNTTHNTTQTIIKISNTDPTEKDIKFPSLLRHLPCYAYNTDPTVKDIKFPSLLRHLPCYAYNQSVCALLLPFSDCSYFMMQTSIFIIFCLLKHDDVFEDDHNNNIPVPYTPI